MVVCGIDIEGLLCVINIDLLWFVEDYVYWIGCIGCVGKLGEVILFVSCEEENILFDIEKLIG